MDQIPVCDYEGSDYQASFWEQGSRGYEDACEAVALRRLLPPGGKRMLELGAGAGRNTPRYQGFDEIALVDYSSTQLAQARERLEQAAELLGRDADACIGDGKSQEVRSALRLTGHVDEDLAVGEVVGARRDELGAQLRRDLNIDHKPQSPFQQAIEHTEVECGVEQVAVHQQTERRGGKW